MTTLSNNFTESTCNFVCDDVRYQQVGSHQCQNLALMSEIFVYVQLSCALQETYNRAGLLHRSHTVVDKQSRCSP